MKMKKSQSDAKARNSISGQRKQLSADGVPRCLSGALSTGIMSRARQATVQGRRLVKVPVHTCVCVCVEGTSAAGRFDSPVHAADGLESRVFMGLSFRGVLRFELEWRMRSRMFCGKARWRGYRRD